MLKMFRIVLSCPNKKRLISKLDLCDDGSFSLTIFKATLSLSVYHISCSISVCPFVALSTAKFAENVHIVLSI